ncbi:ScbR family autoregulator-binding transcription factor [Streptomyces sp. MAR25Y5]|uniref:ScbR family autoregulator-binding transcription factor n=1 Tax=Streptomyces sp. MAR25Y5 TaxID=2962028 RepID=UPI0020B74CB0|nr:ScbR family autoregulator-binding transcription factor [Streptomyces sp. MAR25Y5]MCP3771537.1 TetR/AcrR family transcriptional regulator [Streptomyces sp. MAR25Y5]
MMVKQERAARTRRALVLAAAEVFASEGFALASLSAISRRAGVSNGALHFHFENKKALADAVQQEAAASMARMTDLAETAGDALQALVNATHGLMGRIADDTVVRAGFTLCADPSRGRDGELRRQWQEWIEATLARAEREGLLAEGASSERLAPTVVAATVGFEVLGSRDPQWLSEGKTASFWELVLPQMAARGGASTILPAAAALPEEAAEQPG